MGLAVTTYGPKPVSNGHSCFTFWQVLLVGKDEYDRVTHFSVVDDPVQLLSETKKGQDLKKAFFVSSTKLKKTRPG